MQPFNLVFPVMCLNFIFIFSMLGLVKNNLRKEDYKFFVIYCGIIMASTTSLIFLCIN